MHNIDINTILATVKPWTLSVKLDGVDYPVRRLSSADFKRLSESANHGKDENNAFLANLFGGEQKPNVAEWDSEIGGAVLSVITAYYQQAVIQKTSTWRPRRSPGCSRSSRVVRPVRGGGDGNAQLLDARSAARTVRPADGHGRRESLNDAAWRRWPRAGR